MLINHAGKNEPRMLTEGAMSHVMRWIRLREWSSGPWQRFGAAGKRAIDTREAPSWATAPRSQPQRIREMIGVD